MFDKGSPLLRPTRAIDPEILTDATGTQYAAPRVSVAHIPPELLGAIVMSMVQSSAGTMLPEIAAMLQQQSTFELGQRRRGYWNELMPARWDARAEPDAAT